MLIKSGGYQRQKIKEEPIQMGFVHVPTYVLLLTLICFYRGNCSRKLAFINNWFSLIFTLITNVWNLSWFGELILGSSQFLLHHQLRQKKCCSYYGGQKPKSLIHTVPLSKTFSRDFFTVYLKREEAVVRMGKKWWQMKGTEELRALQFQLWDHILFKQYHFQKNPFIAFKVMTLSAAYSSLY